MCEHGGTDNRDLLGMLDAAADLLRAAGRVPLGGGVPDVALTQAVQKLEAVARIAQGRKCAVIGEIAQRQAHRGQAAGSTPDLLARVLHLAPGEARREAELAAGLALVPDTAEALADGRIGLGQAHVAVKKANEVKDRDDGELLVKQIDATAASAGQLMDRNRLAREIDTELAKTNMDVLADRERTAFQRRNLTWTVRDGMHVLHAELDPVGGATVRAMLDSLSHKTDDTDTRSFPQRQADALVEMATLAQEGRGKPQGTLQAARVLLVTTVCAGMRQDRPAALQGTRPRQGLGHPEFALGGPTAARPRSVFRAQPQRQQLGRGARRPAEGARDAAARRTTGCGARGPPNAKGMAAPEARPCAHTPGVLALPHPHPPTPLASNAGRDRALSRRPARRRPTAP